jgi:adenosylcobinamide kinase / adenosylcobinamide-phosphate guanylyltransferase
MEKGITFILGGARSGKSTYALGAANLHAGRKAFIATAQALDHEMETRIARHKEERGSEWETFEEPLDIAETLYKVKDRYGAVVLDCLTLWASNLIHAGRVMDKEFDALEAVLLTCTDSPLYIVSNEVGMGIVPEYPLSRVYRDRLGNLNKMVARVSSRVVFMVAGIPMEVKKAG